MLHAFLHLPDTFEAVSRVHALFAEVVQDLARRPAALERVR
jgi:hypothetical protein